MLNKYLRNMKKRFYSKEFKEQAVRLSNQRDNIKELADELGINVQRLYKWRKATQEDSIKKQSPQIKEDTLEIKRLRKATRDIKKSRSHFLQER